MEQSSAPRKTHHRPNGPQFGAALSFEEIARELGCSHQAVHQAYAAGLRKLRRHHPEKLARLRALAAELAAARQARERGQITVSAVPLPW